MPNKEYLEYLASVKWKNLRWRVLIRDNFQCRRCGYMDPKNDVHHKTYARFKNELMADLETLCRDCHERLHDNLRNKALSVDDPQPKPSKKAQSERKKLALAAALDRVRCQKEMALRVQAATPGKSRSYTNPNVLSYTPIRERRRFK